MKAIPVLAVLCLIQTVAFAQAARADDLDAIRQLVEAGRFADALPLARHAVVTDSGSAVAHDLLGTVLAGLNRPAEAVPELRTAAAQAPASKSMRAHLGDALMALYIKGMADWVEKHGNSTMLGTLTSDIPGAQAGGSFRYAPDGGPVPGETDRTSNAARLENDARNPRFDPGRSNMGALRRPVTAMDSAEREKYAAPARASLAAYDDALAIDPSYLPALKGRATALYALGEYGPSGEAFEKAGAAARTDDALFQMAARSFERASRPADAVRMWNEVTRIAPARLVAYRSLQDLYEAMPGEQWEVRYCRAMTQLLSGKPETALDGLRQVTDEHPDFAPAWRARGSACLALKDHRKAVDYLNKAAALDAKDGLTEYELGMAYSLGGDTQSAHAHLAKAAQLRPDYPATWFALAQMGEKQNDPDTAIAMYERALELRPDWADAHYNLGALLLEKREGARAVEHLERYLALRPNAPDSKDVRDAVQQVKALETK